MTKFIDTTPAAFTMTSGSTLEPFTYVSLSDPFASSWDDISGGGTGTFTITLHATAGVIGKLADGVAFYDFPVSSYDAASNTLTFTENTHGGPHPGDTSRFPDLILHRLAYTAAAMEEGQSMVIQASLSFTHEASTLAPFPTPSHRFTETVTDPNPITINVAAAATGKVNYAVFDNNTGLALEATGHTYAGPVSYLTQEILLNSKDDLNVSSGTPNSFIHTGSGTDAIDVSKAGGRNVLDGGTGSNYLTGGAGNDTFFVDDRNAPADIWSTVVGFHAGDAATVWGVTPADFALQWVDGQGAAGAEGLTLHAFALDKHTASLTLAGYNTTDLINGRLGVSFGTNDGGNYMLIQGA